MKKLGVFMGFVWLSSVLFAASSVEQDLNLDLARGLEKAARGELKDRGLLLRLEKAFSRSSDRKQQIQIANVLTYAGEASGLRHKYVDFVLGQTVAESVVGIDEIFRLRRLRAERLFEAGKYDAARPDFEYLMQVNQPLVREYAVLKTGWCYMNADKPHLAWQLWMEQSENTIRSGKPLPTNLAHSLGQALVENPKHTSDDFLRLGQLKLDENARTQVVHGMEQGADTVDTSEKMRQWVDAARSLPWASVLATRLLQAMGGTGTRACLFLPWVTVLDTQSQPVSALSYQVTESCLLWIQSASKKDAKPVAKASAKKGTQKSITADAHARFQSADTVLAEWLPKQPWAKDQLRVPFLYYSLKAQWLGSCEAGLEWIAEPGMPPYRSRAPVLEIVQVCMRAMDSVDSAKSIARFFEPSDGTVVYLSSAKDPLLFLALALLDEPRFEKALLESLLNKSQQYQPTLLPVLVLERLEVRNQTAAAESLWDAVVGKQADDAKQSSVWRQILLRRVKRLKDSKASPQVLHALLTKTLLPPADAALSEFGYGMWLGYLALEVELARSVPQETQVRLDANPTAKSTAESLLTRPRAKAYPALAAASIEMMGWYGLSTLLWESITGPDAVAFSKVRSEALEVRLLNSLVTKSLVVSPQTEIGDASLRFIVDLGQRLNSQDSASWLTTVKPVGNSIVARDTKYLQSLQQKQQRLLLDRKSAKAAAQQALDWIQFLESQKRAIGSRTWCHEVFFRAALDSMVHFCGKAQERIPVLKKTVQGAGSSAAQWDEFFSAFEKKLDACKDSVGVRRASL
jgi:hypothetical protein